MTTLKTAHTPGPWKAITTGYNRVDIRTDVPMNSRAIGEVYRDGSEPTGLANARLIAAAPELLDALRDVAGDEPYVDRDGDTESTDEWLRHATESMLRDHIDFLRDKARAAFAKATG